MKFIRYFLILVVAIFGVSAVDANAQRYADNNKRNSSRTLEQKVFKQLIKLPYYGVFDNIKFEMSGNTVILSGKVAVARNKDDAENAVEDIEGVESVVNNIEVLPPSGFDHSIRRQILRSFADKGLYRYLWEPNPSVRIIVQGGRVELEGYVRNRGDYDLMNILANSVSNVFQVRNNLVIEKDDVR
ncbi:MAG: BON domain-containing protein [Acidobacteriota bacterium]|nr:BON domain-containing protein [Acidobacteriota bacterium]